MLWNIHTILHIHLAIQHTWHINWKKTNINPLLELASSNIQIHFNCLYDIIIIKVCWQHGFLWFSLAIHPSQSLQLVSLLFVIKCPHRADECKFLLVSQHWCVHVQKSIWGHSLWVQPSTLWVQHAFLIICKTGGKWLLFYRVMLPGFIQCIQHSCVVII